MCPSPTCRSAEILTRAEIHFFNDFDAAPEMETEIRKPWKGPLALATDFMVINVTKDIIVQRMAVISNHVWPNKARHAGFATAERKERMQMSAWLREKELYPKG